MKTMARIFLCHAIEDKPQVRDFYKQLKALGFEPWLDEEDILPGQDWDFEIQKALEEADFVIVFLSKRSVDKIGYVQREFRRAMYHSEEMPEGVIHTIPVKLDDCKVPNRFRRHQWANLYEEGAFDRIVRSLRLGLEQRSKTQKQTSSMFSNKSERLSDTQAKAMLKKHGLFDSSWNRLAKGIKHEYQLEQENKNVYDKTSDLLWQQSGSESTMLYYDAKAYIEKLNQERNTGYSDWRLPTLAEAMSLMEPNQKNGDLHIDPVFDKTQCWIWTADYASADMVWFVHFIDGLCSRDLMNGSRYYVRAVRSGQE